MGHNTVEITSHNFQDEVLGASLPVLVDFTADWCPPCKMLDPIVDEIAGKYVGQLTVGSVDSDSHPDLTQEYGVMGLPTLILFRDGQPVERIVGYTPRDKIEARLLPHLHPQNA